MEATEVIAALTQRLTQGGYEAENVTIEGRDSLVGRRSDFRWMWFATRLHTFVVVFHIRDLSEDLAEELTSAAQKYAIEHKGGLPRGLQTGTAAVVVFLSDPSWPSVASWFNQSPTQRRFAALRFPVLVELGSGALTYYRGRMTLGWVYAGHLRGVAEEVIAPAVRRT